MKSMRKSVPFLLLLAAAVAAGAIAMNTGLTAQESMAGEILAAHNAYRAELSLPELTWSDSLQAHAQVWANKLAAKGGHSLQHSTIGERPGEGENLWMGTTGYFTYTQMVKMWGDEKQHFQYGTFPNVSKTGNWAQVGHYTQIIWKDTKQVGCAKATAGGNDILVCRYSPPGNYMGKKVY